MDNPYEPPQVADTLLTEADDALDAAGTPLFQDRSFWGMTATQFLGAFNDNLFKQLALLLAVGGPASLIVASSMVDGSSSPPRTGPDLQSLAMFLFATPFLLFSGLAGFVSERLSKR